MLSLELLQWQHEQAKFDERAVDFAVAFELSPPSWEPPPRMGDKDAVATAGKVTVEASGRAPTDQDNVVWEGVLAGPMPQQLAQLTGVAQAASVAQIDMTDVDRVDFIFAGALLNAITRIETLGKAVQITGATPIVRALLLLIGISPRHFVKKVD